MTNLIRLLIISIYVVFAKWCSKSFGGHCLCHFSMFSYFEFDFLNQLTSFLFFLFFLLMPFPILVQAGAHRNSWKECNENEWCKHVLSQLWSTNKVQKLILLKILFLDSQKHPVHRHFMYKPSFNHPSIIPLPPYPTKNLLCTHKHIRGSPWCSG